MEVLIKNNTKEELKVFVFPKEKYKLEGNLKDSMYLASEHSYGPLRMRIDTFNRNDYNCIKLFSTDNLKFKPTELVNQVFDSIKIILLNSNAEICFKNYAAINYKTNIYSRDSLWSVKQNTEYENTMFKEHKIEITTYYFSIDSAEILSK